MDLKKSIELYFKDYKLNDRIKDVGIYIVREDGIPLFGNAPRDGAEDIAALTSGVWQAAEVMYSRFASQSREVLDFRFQFDSSSSGITIIPLNLKSDRLFLTAIFKEVVNPGQIKALLRGVALSLTDHINKKFKKAVSSSHLSDAFENLTDNEIDKAFALAGFN